MGMESGNRVDYPNKIRIKDLVDNEGFTLLHMAVFKNKSNCFNELMKRAAQEMEKQEITRWINMQTQKDKFAAIHYASFRGNIEMCQTLLDNGANMNLQNQYGLNVMHIAAQGDQPISLYFFKQKGMHLCSKDKRGSTPLHWACYQGSEVALIYLLGWLK